MATSLKLLDVQGDVSSLVPETLEFITTLHGELIIIVLIGDGRSGKSFLASKIAGEEVFVHVPTAEAVTVGIDVYAKPMDDGHLLVLDCEGGNNALAATHQIVNVLGMIVASKIVYLVAGMASDAALDNLDRNFATRSLITGADPDEDQDLLFVVNRNVLQYEPGHFDEMLRRREGMSAIALHYRPEHRGFLTLGVEGTPDFAQHLEHLLETIRHTSQPRRLGGVPVDGSKLAHVLRLAHTQFLDHGEVAMPAMARVVVYDHFLRPLIARHLREFHDSLPADYVLNVHAHDARAASLDRFAKHTVHISQAYVTMRREARDELEAGLGEEWDTFTSRNAAALERIMAALVAIGHEEAHAFEESLPWEKYVDDSAHYDTREDKLGNFDARATAACSCADPAIYEAYPPTERVKLDARMNATWATFTARNEVALERINAALSRMCDDEVRGFELALPAEYESDLTHVEARRLEAVHNFDAQATALLLSTTHAPRISASRSASTADSAGTSASHYDLSRAKSGDLDARLSAAYTNFTARNAQAGKLVRTCTRLFEIEEENKRLVAVMESERLGRRTLAKRIACVVGVLFLALVLAATRIRTPFDGQMNAMCETAQHAARAFDYSSSSYFGLHANSARVNMTSSQQHPPRNITQRMTLTTTSHPHIDQQHKEIDQELEPVTTALVAIRDEEVDAFERSLPTEYTPDIGRYDTRSETLRSFNTRVAALPSDLALSPSHELAQHQERSHLDARLNDAWAAFTHRNSAALDRSIRELGKIRDGEVRAFEASLPSDPAVYTANITQYDTRHERMQSFVTLAALLLGNSAKTKDEVEEFASTQCAECRNLDTLLNAAWATFTHRNNAALEHINHALVKISDDEVRDFEQSLPVHYADNITLYDTRAGRLRNFVARAQALYPESDYHDLFRVEHGNLDMRLNITWAAFTSHNAALFWFSWLKWESMLD